MHRCAFIITALLLASAPAQGQTITTVAGSYGIGFCGDGGPATEACLDAPYGVAVDAVGNLYIADTFNHRIRKVDVTGTIQTVAGDGTSWGDCPDGVPATRCSLNHPAGLALDAAGNLFVADSWNQRVRKVSPAGTITTVAGSGLNGFCGDGGPATSACLHDPVDVAVDDAGNLYIADSLNHRVRRVDLTGTIDTIAGNGTESFCGDGGPATSSCLSAWGVTVDAEGNLFIAEGYGNRVRKVDPAGVIVTVAGNGSGRFCGDGQPATSACLYGVSDVAVDAVGNLFLADGNNHRVRRVDVTGRISTVAGSRTRGFCGDGGWPTAACLEFPDGIALGQDGTLFIAEWGSSRVRRVDGLSSRVSTLTVAKPVLSGCRTTVGHVTLSSPSVGGTSVMLTSDDPHVVVPGIVTVAAGAISKAFPIATSPVAGEQLATIQASTGWSATSTALTLKPMVLKSLVLTPNPVVGGNAVTGTVTMECAAGPSDIVVSLLSSKPTYAWPATSTVTVLRTATTASFTVFTKPVTVVAKPSIKGTANGVTKSKTLIVNPGS